MMDYEYLTNQLHAAISIVLKLATFIYCQSKTDHFTLDNVSPSIEFSQFLR